MATMSPPVPASTSTPETAPEKTRQQVRRKNGSAPLTVVPIPKAGLMTIRGETSYAHAGDMLLTEADGSPIEVVPAEVLAELYEPFPEGEIILSPEHITRIAKVLRFGATKTAADLTKAVEQMAAIRIGGIKVEFNPAQVEELKNRAAKRGWTVEKYMQYLVDRFTQDLWNY